MSSGHSDEFPGTAAAADNRDCSPDRGDGEREERDAAAVTPKTASGTAAALAAEDAKRLTGAAIRAEPTAGGPRANEKVDVGKNMLDEISLLKQQQKETWEARKMVQKQLRNAERRRKRLKQRAKQLSDSDLLAVISLRNHERSMGQRDSPPDEIDREDAESIPDDPGAGPSSAATPTSSTAASSKKLRRK